MKILLPLLMLTACAAPVDNAPKPGDVIQVPGFEWRVVDKRSLEAAYIDFGMPFNEGDKLDGFMGYTADHRPVVYTLPPTRVNDSATCTLGHEVLHIVKGDYHPSARN